MLPNMLTARNILEQAKRLARVVTDPPGAPPSRLREFTSIRLPPGLVRPENVKRYAQERDPAAIDLIVGHVTDVTGGFGIQKWGKDGWQTWLKRLRGGDVPSIKGEAFSLLEDIKAEFGRLSDRELAEVLALCSRYAQVPYHRLASRKLGELENRPFGHRTKASGAGNGGIALAVDCGHREEIDNAFVKAGQNMVAAAVVELVAHGDPRRPIAYAPHGCFSRSRWNDTHRIVHLRVYKPIILQLRRESYNVYIDYERAVSGGRAITTRDDPEAHFDARGRRVRTPEGTPI